MAKARRARQIGFIVASLGMLIMLFAWSGATWPRPRREANLTPKIDQGALSPTTPPSTRTPEPLVPSRTPLAARIAIGPSLPGDAGADRADPIPGGTGAQAPGDPTATPPAPEAQPVIEPPTMLPAPAATFAEAATAPAGQVPGQPEDFWQGRPRWGVSVGGEALDRYNVSPLHLGWYMDWMARPAGEQSNDVEYAPMARVSGGVLQPAAQSIADMARARPGRLWLIGNEPDVKWQDNVEAATYARLYHEAYTAIKGADATAQVSIGGISEPTPLRLRYLDAVLASYREQFGVPAPVEVWNIHNYLLREERGSWGVDIPPGMADATGRLYEIDDSGNLADFKQQVVDFRRWMADRGYRDRPLLITEFGVPMPPDYGFPAERVIAFWTSTFDYFRTASDPEIGFPADENHLVQAWCWFSLADSEYVTGNVFDPQTGAITPLGRAWAAYTAQIH